ADGHVRRHKLEHPLLAAAENRVIRAAHSQVADVGAAAGKDLGIGGGDVGVGAEDDRAAAVEVMAHRDLFAGSLGVHVAHADAHVVGHLVQHAVGGGEGIVGRQVHVDAPQQ